MGIAERRAREFERREREILSATLALLQQQPWGAVTVEAIAARAEIGKSTVYKHFASKNELAARLVTDCRQRLVFALQRLEGGVSPQQTLSAYLRTLAEHALEAGPVLLLAPECDRQAAAGQWSAELRQRYLRAGAELEALDLSVLRDCTAAGLCRAESASAARITVWSLIAGAVQAHLGGGPEVEGCRSFVDTVEHLVSRALGAGGTAPDVPAGGNGAAAHAMAPARPAGHDGKEAAWLQQVLDSLPVWIAVSDPEGRPWLVNRALAEAAGNVTPPPADGPNGRDGPDNTAALRLPGLHDAAARASQREVTLPDGRVESRRVHRFPLRDGAGATMGAVTWSEPAPAAWEAPPPTDTSQRLLHSVFNVIPHHVFVKDRESRIVMANRALADFYGSTPEALVGHSVHEYGSAASDEEHSIIESADKWVFDTGAQKEYPELNLTRADGEKRVVHILKQPVLDENNRVIAVVGTGQDVTERKLADEALHKALAEVEELKARLEAENSYLQEEIKLHHNFEEIVGRSPALLATLRSVERVAGTSATVLILGESGTGKELVARAIHNISGRNHRPLVKVNCAALPPTLIESELFGHERGAFTGAVTRKIGRFELAHEGTIFLDEIGDLPLELQAKLLRVLQEGELERLGNARPRRVDVRVIAATNHDLEEEVRSGRFREDLFYRLSVFPVLCPPLRERKDDIPVLTSHFIRKYAAKMGKEVHRIPERVMDALCRYAWPGNVRELENVIERAVILSSGDTLELNQRLGFLTDPLR